ncbi:uncharacterized protein LOC131543570 isoform X1 [Onychostoma macrolepis]|uniref:uncharacterized protein LOC131543570 isoform X1 n=1 Tax=Onychostoma macrolepis TaxID=369639 RepID=UPI00272CCF7B|nr:uncharacterized protein LOC131543570 isoform X1 [Onychostoma macrolepis]
MSDKHHMCLLGLITLSALLTGTSGAEVTHVFCSSGENVRLSCNNALPGCTSTTWIYTRHSEAVELIAGGIKKKDTEIHERLSLGSDCSLNIKNVTKEDRGSYSCRQYVNGPQQGTDARVYLHVLHVSSSSSQSEIRSGRSVTLSCQLYYDRVSCDTLVGSERIDLIWVNQAGVNLQTDSRFQIFSSEQCLSSLTTTLLNEDHNREWRCQVTQRNQLKTSATYTVKYSAPTETKTPSPVTSSTSAAAPTQPGVKDSTLIPVSSSDSEKSSQTTAAPTTRDIKITTSHETTSAAQQITQITPNPSTTTQRVSPSVIGIVVAAVLAVLVTAVILWVVRKKRADNRKVTNDSVVSIIMPMTHEVDALAIILSIITAPGQTVSVICVLLLVRLNKYFS